MAFVSGTLISLILSFTIMASAPGPLPAKWRKYIEKIGTTCITSQANGVLPKVTYLFVCVNYQRTNLRCVSPNTFYSLQDRGIDINEQDKPCGFIFFPNRVDHYQHQHLWTITVHHQFYMNLTMLEFVLSMPYRKCDLDQGSEMVFISSKKGTVSEKLSFCGERSSFSILWKRSDALVVYKSVLARIYAGHFLIQYQACEKKAITSQTQLVDHTAAIVNSTTPMSFNLGEMKHLKIGRRRVLYVIHLLGNRMRVLDVGLAMDPINKDSIILQAFDGPGPSELHRHIDEEYLMDGYLIYFRTFQGYLRIECDIKLSEKFSVYYMWTLATQYAKLLVLNDLIHFNAEQWCSGGDGVSWYCIYQFQASHHQNIQITLDHVRFVGPDYLGDSSEHHNCLLAGVTIIDDYRVILVENAEQHLLYLGDVPKEMAIDYFLPEITTCYQIPFVDSGDSSRTAFELPLMKMVSSGSLMNLLIYAYGAYIDVKKSIVELTISPSDCIGLILSCNSIPSDGFIEIGSTSVVSPKADIKNSICPFGNMLTATIHGYRSKRFRTDISVCTNTANGLTTIKAKPRLLTASVQGHLGSCLFLQMNPYAIAVDKKCALLEHDYIERIPLDYNIDIKEPISMHCSREPSTAESYYLKVVGMKGRRNSSTELLSPNQNMFGGKLVQLSINVVPLCIKLAVSANFFCTQPQIQDNPPTIQTAQTELQREFTAAACRHYSFNVRQNYTHVVYVEPLPVIQEMTHMILAGTKMDTLITLMTNWQLGKMAIISLKLNEQCSRNCSRFKVQIAYWSITAWTAVLIEWQICVKHISHEIQVFDLPMTVTLVYITRLGECGGLSCLLNVDMNYVFNKALPFRPFPKTLVPEKQSTTFAEYVFYWTSHTYTWYEAEDVCQQAGDMHLASITSEEEYLLVKGILAGDTSVYGTKHPVGILTPCRLGTPLCAIYIGLQVNRSRVAWSDGKPHGFILSHDNRLAGVRASPEHEHLERLNQPLSLDESCSMLVGSPGPKDMDFVGVPCNQKLQIPGIVCIRGGQTMQLHQLTYRLTHFKPKSDNDLNLPSIGGGFNVMTLHAAMSRVIDGAPKSSIPYADMLADEVYFELHELHKNVTEWVWEESWLPCNQTPVLCKLFDVNSRVGDKIHKLTQEILVASDITKPPSSGSVYISDDSLVASDHCPRLTFLTEKGCVYLVDKPAIKNIVSKYSLDHICANHLPDSRVYVISANALDKDIITKLTERRPTLCVDQYDTVSVILLGENEVLFYPIFGQGSKARFILCTVDPLPPRCPVHYTRCNNGCISDLLLCDGKTNCDNGEDESECNNLCKEGLSVTTSVMYCLNECHPNNCTCSDLYFQCLSGGCLHSSKLCDGKSDCQDTSDESICTKYFYPFPTETQSVELDDRLYTQYYCVPHTDELDTLEFETHCSTLNHIKCQSGHPTCYPVDKRCVYDHTDNGDMKYCKIGRHLHGCQNVNCSGSFKCFNSYCVPAYKVCNGEVDCPYGDDEHVCPLNNCHNMLRCGDMCVHPIDICDGTTNCMDGEDELLCDLPECPHDCTCNGYAIKCTYATMFDASFKHVRIMSLKYSQNVFLNTAHFQYLTDLLFLDMAYCNVDISPETPLFKRQNALLKLDLSHNLIKDLKTGALDGLSNLQVLDLSWNPLTHLEPHVLDGIVNLRVLSLSHCKLTTIPYINLLDTHVLDTVNISHAKILDFGFCEMKANLLVLLGTSIRVSGINTDDCWQNITRIVTDQHNLCCSGVLMEHCKSKGLGNKASCPPLFWHQILAVYSLLLSAILVACNGCVFVYKAFRHDADALLISNLAVADVLVIIPLVWFTHWHLSHGARIVFFEPFLAPNSWCVISGCVLTGITHLSTLLSLLITLVRYFGIVHNKNIKADYKLQFHFVIVCAWAAFASISVLLASNNMETPATFVDCLFGHQQSIKRQLLLIYSTTNTVITIVNVCLYGSILKVILTTHKQTEGQKHGRDMYVSSVTKLIAINICSSIAVLSQACFLTCVFFVTGVSSQTIVSLIILLFPLQAICNPFLYSLCTRRFLTTLHSLFLTAK